MPGGWTNVRSLHLGLPNPAAPMLPVFVDAGGRQGVKLPDPKPKPEPVVSRPSTLDIMGFHKFVHHCSYHAKKGLM